MAISVHLINLLLKKVLWYLRTQTLNKRKLSTWHRQLLSLTLAMAIGTDWSLYLSLRYCDWNVHYSVHLSAISAVIWNFVFLSRSTETSDYQCLPLATMISDRNRPRPSIPSVTNASIQRHTINSNINQLQLGTSLSSNQGMVWAIGDQWKQHAATADIY